MGPQPLLLTNLLPLTRPRNTPMRSPPTPSPMLWLMTTPRPTSMLRRPPMVPAMSRVDTPWLFPMAESSTSSTSPTDDGYVADVTYEGTAVYPEAKPYAPAPAPAYHA